MEKNNKEDPSSEKPSRRRAPKATEDIGFQSFLVPKHYRNQSLYRTGWAFRFTFLFGILLLISAGLCFLQWKNSKEATKKLVATQNIENEESSRLQSQSNAFRSVREKYKELETLRRQLRVPLAPILDSIEKTIPPEISINRFTSTCPPIASTSTIKRRMQAQLEVFIPSGTSLEDPIIGAWPEALAETLLEKGILVSDAAWGPEREFRQMTEDEKKKKVAQAVGSIKELNLTFELNPE